VTDLVLTYTLEATESALPGMNEEFGLVQRARAGEMDAFEEIMQRYENRILRYLSGAVGNAEVAEELCQETFLAAYRAFPRTSDDLRLSSWLHTIALNRARSYHRRRRLKTFLPLTDDHASAAADLQQSVVARDSVLRALSRLPKAYREPLLLQLGSGLTCKEIGEVLGCSEGAVKVRLMRARQAFRREYKDEDREP
jgi:RNA polymerase sigma-70 factor (ECF subfamily)